MIFRSKRLITAITAVVALVPFTGCGNGTSDVSSAKRQAVDLPPELDGLALGPHGTVAVTDLTSGFAIVDGSGTGSPTEQPRLLLATPSGLRAETLPTARLVNVSIWPTTDALVIVGMPCENIDGATDVSRGQSSWFELCGTTSYVVVRYELASGSSKILSTSLEGSAEGFLWVMASNGDILLAERGTLDPAWVSVNGRSGEVVEIPAGGMQGDATACATGDGFTAAAVPFDEPISDAPASFSDTVEVFRLGGGGETWVTESPAPTELKTRIAEPLGCGPESVMFMTAGAPGEPARPVQLVSDGPDLAWIEGPVEGFPSDGHPPNMIPARSTMTAWDGPDLERGYAVHVLADSAWKFIGRAAGPDPPSRLGHVAVSGGSVLFLASAGDGLVLHLL